MGRKKIEAPPTVRPLRELGVCPVCRRPGRRQKIKNHRTMFLTDAQCCTLFGMLANLKFADNEQDSAREAHRQLHEYHAELCPGCRLPVDTCRRKKILRALRYARKFNVGGDGYPPENFVADWLKEHPCK